MAIKVKKYFTHLLFSAALVSGGFLSACSDDLTIGSVDEANYETVKDVYCYLRDVQTGRTSQTLDLHDQVTERFDLYVGLSKTADKGVDVEISVDPDYLAAFNSRNDTSYEIYPALSLVSIEEAGAVVIAPGDKRSGSVEVAVGKDQTVEEGKVYAIPLTAAAKTDGVKLSGDGTHYMLFVKDAGAVPDATKGAVKTVMFLEVNDTNPLNLLEWNMKNSGKPLFDILVIFSGNINYNEQTGRVYVYNNPNVQFLLDNREQYLKPLKDRGIKILMGILGNHDRAGVSQLADHTARDFAQELKAYCEAYDLDGVNFDDEYSGLPVGPGFVQRSSSAGARLCYETKRAMPDKICSIYAYLTLYSFDNVFNGMRPGDYLDFAVNDYGGSVEPHRFFGMVRSQCAGASLQIRHGDSTSEYAMRNLRDAGYGYQMNFALDPSVYASAVNTFQNVARGLYDDDLDFSGYYYEKNSTVRKPFSEYGKK